MQNINNSSSRRVAPRYWMFRGATFLYGILSRKTKKATTILRETERLPPFILSSSLWKCHPSPNQWRFSYSCGWYQIWFSPTCLVGRVYTIVSSFSYRARYYLFSFQFDLRCDIHFWNICSLAVIRINLAVCCLQNLHWGIAIQIHRRVVFWHLFHSTWNIYRFSFWCEHSITFFCFIIPGGGLRPPVPRGLNFTEKAGWLPAFSYWSFTANLLPLIKEAAVWLNKHT